MVTFPKGHCATEESLADLRQSTPCGVPWEVPVPRPACFGHYHIVLRSVSDLGQKDLRARPLPNK